MKKDDKKVILFDSDEAAIYETREVTGWFGVQDGKYYGNDERLARSFNSNYSKCSKNPDHPIVSNHHVCQLCRKEWIVEQYENLPKEVWDGEKPLVITYTDHYFFDKESLIDYCKEHNVDPKDLMLVFCEPNYISRLEPEELYEEVWYDGAVLSPKLTKAFEEINKLISEEEAVSWSEGKIAAIVSF